MPTLRNLLATSLLFIALTQYVSAQPYDDNREDPRDVEAFQKLLSEVDPPSLHEALHSMKPKKYKHGAFPEDRTAVEVIHKEEPSVATSIVNLARRQAVELIDLDKRQDNGTSATNTPPRPSTRVTPVPPISEGSTLSPAPTTEASTTPAPATTPSTTPVAPSSSAAPSPSTTAPVTSAPASSTPATSSPAATTGPSISLTAGEIITTTNAAGLVIISTVGGGASTVSPSRQVSTTTSNHNAATPTSLAVQTTTLPNGSQSVVTAVTVVGQGAGGADTPTGTAGVGSTSASSQPGLQTGEAVMSRGWGKEMVLVVGGAVAFAGMM